MIKCVWVWFEGEYIGFCGVDICVSFNIGINIL